MTAPQLLSEHLGFDTLLCLGMPCPSCYDAGRGLLPDAESEG